MLVLGFGVRVETSAGQPRGERVPLTPPAFMREPLWSVNPWRLMQCAGKDWSHFQQNQEKPPRVEALKGRVRVDDFAFPHVLEDTGPFRE